jgi:hypothetical protein
MIIEISIVAIVLLKLIGAIELSWTLTTIFVSILVIVEVKFTFERRKMMTVIYEMAGAVDRKVDDLEFDIEQRAKNHQAREGGDW